MRELKILKEKNNITAQIATLGCYKLFSKENAKEEAEKLLSELDRIKTTLLDNQRELTVMDFLNEKVLMSGAVDSNLLAGLSNLGFTINTREELSKLGFNTALDSTFEELGCKMATAYNTMGTFLKQVFDKAIAGEEVYVDMIKRGVSVSADAFLTFETFITSTGKEIPKEASDEEIVEYMSKYKVEYEDEYNEWKEESITKTTNMLIKYPENSAYINPVGFDVVLDAINTVDSAMYDELTDYGKVLDTGVLCKGNFGKLYEALDDKVKPELDKVFAQFRDVNSINSYNIGGTQVAIPNATSIPDALIGLVLDMGRTLEDIEEIVNEEGMSDTADLWDQALDDDIKTAINDVSNLIEYDNPQVIAVNLITQCQHYINIDLFTNPLIKFQPDKYLSTLTKNLALIIYPKPEAIEE